jgi:hypothetical protein
MPDGVTKADMGLAENTLTADWVVTGRLAALLGAQGSPTCSSATSPAGFWCRFIWLRSPVVFSWTRSPSTRCLMEAPAHIDACPYVMPGAGPPLLLPRSPGHQRPAGAPKCEALRDPRRRAFCLRGHLPRQGALPRYGRACHEPGRMGGDTPPCERPPALQSSGVSEPHGRLGRVEWEALPLR